MKKVLFILTLFLGVTNVLMSQIPSVKLENGKGEIINTQ